MLWADWNDGSRKETWHRWDQNPFNVARGGPAERPDELLDDTVCRDVDGTGLAPVPCDVPAELKGAVVGNDRVRLGWFRDARCGPPDWPMERLSGQDVTVMALGTSWQVEFFDPATGQCTGKSAMAVRDQRLRIVLPAFEGSVAVRLKQLDTEVFRDERKDVR